MFMYNVWIMNDVRLIKWLGINLLNTCKIMKECGEYLLTLLIERNLVDPVKFYLWIREKNILFINTSNADQ